jgi:glyoxylate/hydroxypyruvate reductase A
LAARLIEAMSSILLAIMGWDPKGWEQRFRALAPQHDIRVWPDAVGDPAGIRYACVWKPPAGLLAGFPNLKAIFSLGAGADDLMADPSLPDVPVVRIVDPDLTMRMTEYVILHVLMCHRRQRLYDAQQRERVWHEHSQPVAGEVVVGVMGLGVLGASAAQMLQRIGFKVAGWSRTPKTLRGIETFHGPQGPSRSCVRARSWFACCRRRRPRAASSIAISCASSGSMARCRVPI